MLAEKKKQETEEVKMLLSSIQKANDRDKDIILASLKGMLLVVKVNEKGEVDNDEGSSA